MIGKHLSSSLRHALRMDKKILVSMVIISIVLFIAGGASFNYLSSIDANQEGVNIYVPKTFSIAIKTPGHSLPFVVANATPGHIGYEEHWVKNTGTTDGTITITAENFIEPVTIPEPPEPLDNNIEIGPKDFADVLNMVVYANTDNSPGDSVENQSYENDEIIYNGTFRDMDINPFPISPGELIWLKFEYSLPTDINDEDDIYEDTNDTIPYTNYTAADGNISKNESDNAYQADGTEASIVFYGRYEEEGRGGGGGTACVPEWNCTEWGECQPDGYQYRTCYDIDNCHLTYNKPEEKRECEYEPEERAPKSSTGGPCGIDEDCLEGRLCIQNICIEADCRADEDCEEGEICEDYRCIKKPVVTAEEEGVVGKAFKALMTSLAPEEIACTIPVWLVMLILALFTVYAYSLNKYHEYPSIKLLKRYSVTAILSFIGFLASSIIAMHLCPLPVNLIVLSIFIIFSAVFTFSCIKKMKSKPKKPSAKILLVLAVIGVIMLVFSIGFGSKSLAGYSVYDADKLETKSSSGYFSDIETSPGNIFEAGTIDIEVNYQNPWMDEIYLELTESNPEFIPHIITNVGENPAKIWEQILIIEDPSFLGMSIVYDLSVNGEPVIDLYENIHLAEISEMWIELGILAPGESMEVVQSYHYITEWLEEYKSQFGEMIILNKNFFAQQVVNDSPPPEAGPPYDGFTDIESGMIFINVFSLD